MTWTENHIKQLKKQGKIRDYKTTGKGKSKLPSDKKSKAIIWLDLNLPYFAGENELEITTEYQFCPDRKFRSDYAIVSHKLLIEYEGGIFMKKGGHSSASGIQRDIEKYELAQQLGFTVIRLTAANYKTVLEKLREILK